LRNGGFDVPILDDEDDDDDDEAVPEAVLEVEATALRDEDEDEDDAVLEAVLEVEATAQLDEDGADKAEDVAAVVDLSFFFVFSLFSSFSSTKPPIFNFSSDQLIRSTHLTRSIIF
jgi:hypothetical protein